jgi:hypothetical protein
VTADIPEKDIPFIYHGHAKPQFVEIRVLAYPKEVFHGSITYVGDVRGDDVWPRSSLGLITVRPIGGRLARHYLDAA